MLGICLVNAACGHQPQHTHQHCPGKYEIGKLEPANGLCKLGLLYINIWENQDQRPIAGFKNQISCTFV